MTNVMRNILKALMFGCLLLSLAASFSLAQEEMDYSWGTVVEISGQRLVLDEYDYETETNVQVTYEIDSNVEFENIESLEDVQQGNEVEVGFVEHEGQRIVLSLYLEKDVPPVEDEE
ncbi:MAG: hypothetical protein AB1650_03180 [Candidatus Omnitrophota bacterium]